MSDPTTHQEATRVEVHLVIGSYEDFKHLSKLFTEASRLNKQTLYWKGRKYWLFTVYLALNEWIKQHQRAPRSKAEYQNIQDFETILKKWIKDKKEDTANYLTKKAKSAPKTAREKITLLVKKLKSLPIKPPPPPPSSDPSRLKTLLKNQKDFALKTAKLNQLKIALTNQTIKVLTDQLSTTFPQNQAKQIIENNRQIIENLIDFSLKSSPFSSPSQAVQRVIHSMSSSNNPALNLIANRVSLKNLPIQTQDDFNNQIDQAIVQNPDPSVKEALDLLKPENNSSKYLEAAKKAAPTKSELITLFSKTLTESGISPQQASQAAQKIVDLIELKGISNQVLLSQKNLPQITSSLIGIADPSINQQAINILIKNTTLTSSLIAYDHLQLIENQELNLGLFASPNTPKTQTALTEFDLNQIKTAYKELIESGMFSVDDLKNRLSQTPPPSTSQQTTHQNQLNKLVKSLRSNKITLNDLKVLSQQPNKLLTTSEQAGWVSTHTTSQFRPSLKPSSPTQKPPLFLKNLFSRRINIKIPFSKPSISGSSAKKLLSPILSSTGSFFKTSFGKLLKSTLPALGSLGKSFISGTIRLGSLLSAAAGSIGIWGVVAILGVLLGLFVYQQFFNPKNKIESSQAIAIQKGGGIGSYKAQVCNPTTDPNCAVPFCDPTTNNCDWPTPCGCITQGPFASSSHSTLNAIDIGVSKCPNIRHIDVHATHKGEVLEVINTYNENQFEEGSYGNLVRIKNTDSKGNSYQTLYTHLWTIAEYEPIQGQKSGRILSLQDQIPKNHGIGKTDNNGYSLGEHLHYEYRGGDSINSILPEPAPIGCTSEEDCGSICWGI